MAYLYLILSVFLSASSSVFGKYYNRKNVDATDPVSLYNFLLLSSVFIGWGLLYSFNFSFEAGVLPYSLSFAVSYTVCNLGMINALKYGPASLTSLFMSLSLIFVTIWGFIFWNAKLTVLVGIGLVLVVTSIVLCLASDQKEEKMVSLKWLAFVLLACFGNAGCSIIQRSQQTAFGGKYGEMLMTFATVISLAVFFVVFVAKGRREVKTLIKRSWYFPVAAGICNVFLNLLVILLATSELSPNLIYPTIGVGGLIVVILFSIFAFKEKLKWRQRVGIAIGAVATLILSI